VSPLENGTPPAWAPRFPGAALKNVVAVPFQGDMQGSFEFSSPAGLPATVEFYQRELEAGGFVVTALNRFADSGLVQGKSKDGGRQVMAVLQITSGGSKGTVSFTTQHPDKSVPVSGSQLPEFLPIPKGAAVLEQATRATGTTSSGYLKFTSAEAMDALLTSYQEPLERAGFTLERSESPQIGRLSGKSARDGQEVTVVMVPKDAQMEVTVSLTEPR
jgi:hypothetical protein